MTVVFSQNSSLEFPAVECAESLYNISQALCCSLERFCDVNPSRVSGLLRLFSLWLHGILLHGIFSQGGLCNAS